jgi:hypothetical protein
MDGTMKSNKYNKVGFGFLLGILFPFLGFILYGSYWAWNFNKSLAYFVNDIFLGVSTFRSSIMALALIANLIPFLFFIRKDWNQAARGVLAAVFVFVPFIVYFRFY